MSMAYVASSDVAESDFEVHETPSGHVIVTLWGDLGLGWFGRLSTALARRGVSIRSAQANRGTDGRWKGTLEVSVQDGSADAAKLDYLELAREVTHANVAAPVLDRHQIERTAAGALRLRLLAVDRVGLLAGLLDRLELLSLFPERLQITTSERTVDDTLWLRGVAGYSPSLQAELALREVLIRLTRPSDHM